MIPRSTLLLVVLLAAGLGACKQPEMHGTLLDPPMAVPAFTLQGEEGEVSREDFEGRLIVLFFGFTACPDVCPDTMGRIARALSELEVAEANQVQVVLVSVDPERDSPDRTARYARSFHSSFVGLTGTPAQLEDVTSAYGIYHAKEPYADREGYTVDHTAHVLVLDRNGNTTLIWSPRVGPADMAADLRYLIRTT